MGRSYTPVKPAAGRRGRGLARLWWTLATGLLAGCALVAPLPDETSIEQRLSAFPASGLPLEGRVTVYWDKHQIPFIEAERDGDAAFALGLVHAHLRLGQMEAYRRIAQGRVAEMAGPFATDIDHALRILDFGRAAEEIEAGLPPATRAWLERFVAGINHHLETAPELPYEFDALGLEREPWSIRDVLAFGRLAGTDVNWLEWIDLLGLRGRDDWPVLWARLIESGSSSATSFGPRESAAHLRTLLGGLSRSGSNSLAVAPGMSATGAAIMANDPHLGIRLPNIWLLAGIKSPSYHAVGLMIPGIPFIAIGRNPWIAWGGTNMRAASSALFDAEDAAMTTRRERIAVRWWFDREVEIRETRWGPVLSDAPQLAAAMAASGSGPFALSWTGHLPSDEIGAMLKVSRARNFAEFREALSGFAVPGQNMLYADNDGNIGQVMAVRLPGLGDAAPEDLVLPPDGHAERWAEMRGTLDLPFSLNPGRGFLVSANNRPTAAAGRVGYFFSLDDRVLRMAELLRVGGIGIDDVKALQQDVHKASAAALRDLFVERIDASGIAGSAGEDGKRALAAMREWDGRYSPDSRGAVAYEAFREAFVRSFYAARLGETDGDAFADAGRIERMMAADIEGAGTAELDAAMGTALTSAGAVVARFQDWGAMHRLGLDHPLSRLPLVGERFRFTDVPVGGANDTLMKTAHHTGADRHFVDYGSNARHISDMSDVDRNYFVLLGGQDGHIGSTTFLDQTELWLEGAYVEMPLRTETVRERFAHRIELRNQAPAEPSAKR